MLRINLLPGYVAQRRLTRKLIPIFAGVFVVLTVGLLVYNMAVQTPHLNDLKATATTQEQEKQVNDAIKAKTTSERAAIAPITANLKMVSDIYAYNASWAKLYDTMARYTTSDMIYTEAKVDGSTLAIHAWAPSIAAVGRYLQEMYREPDFSSVTIDQLPGYPDAVLNKYYLNGQLIAVGTPPGQAQQGGAAGSGAAYGASAYGGSGMGRSGGGSPYGGGGSPYGGGGRSSSSYPGASGSGSGYPGGSSTRGGGGNGSGPNFNIINEPQTSLDEIVQSKLDPLASTDQQARLRAFIRSRLLRKVIQKREAKGFEFNVTATLKQPLTRPTIPGDTSATTSTSGGYPGGGYPGGGYPGGGRGSSYPGSGGR